MATPPMPPPYSGSPYHPMSMENMVKKRHILGLNVVALGAIWLASLIAILSGDLNARGFARFLTISAAIIGAFGSLAGALGSKRTTDMQNLGLMIWAGLLLIFAVFLLGWIS